MATDAKTDLASLYLEDETAWLDIMAKLVTEGRVEEFDLENLEEFLQSMADRDRREVFSRAVLLITHLLKWEYQPARRKRSWVHTILTQRMELRQDLESGTLHNYVAENFDRIYSEARKRAAGETGLLLRDFPSTPSRTLDGLFAEDADDELLKWSSEVASRKRPR